MSPENQDNMYAFLNVPREYHAAREAYRFACPERFNFAYDVVDRRAREADKVAVLAVDGPSGTVREFRYSDLARRSSRLAGGLPRSASARATSPALSPGAFRNGTTRSSPA